MEHIVYLQRRQAVSYQDNIRMVTPYVPGEQPNQLHMIKLNTNECPYPPSKGVQELLGSQDASKLRLYPDPTSESLVQAIAQSYKVSPKQVFVGVGSDEVLALAFLTFYNGKKPILFPDITYSFYDVWAQLYRIPYTTVPLEEDFTIHGEAYIESGQRRENGGIIFPNPNAPTGVLESLDTIEGIVAANQDVVVIVDEAYIDFGGRSALPLIEKYHNLLVVQTCSKSRALAGMRIGYAFGHETLIQYLLDVKYSFNSYTLNQTSLQGGPAVFQDDVYFREITGKIMATRERVAKQLGELGFTFPKSYGNFIFATHPRYQAKELYEALRREHIYVRYFNKERIDNYLRITIGTDEEMDVFIGFLEEYIKGGNKND
ncbi:MAG: histidinol-phosphate transaminase [Eubacteriales bacterium]